MPSLLYRVSLSKLISINYTHLAAADRLPMLRFDLNTPENKREEKIEALFVIPRRSSKKHVYKRPQTNPLPFIVFSEK